MDTLISVVIPVYNRKIPLRKAIDSVLGQTYPPAEIIVIDDCSPFDLKEYLSEKGYLHDGRIKILRNEVNLGPAGSRNSGISEAKGTLIAFLDSDDYWDKEKLEKQVALFNRNPELDLVYCDMWISDGDNITPSGKALYKDDLWNKLIQGWWTPPNPSTMLMKKTSLKKLNCFDPHLWGTEDLDLWIRLAQQNMKVDFCPECLSYFTFNSNDRITKHKDKLKRANAFLNKWVNYFYQEGDKKNGKAFRSNTLTKFAIESFVDSYRDRDLLVSIKMYFKYLWNKKVFYDLIRKKLIGSVLV